MKTKVVLILLTISTTIYADSFSFLAPKSSKSIDTLQSIQTLQPNNFYYYNLRPIPEPPPNPYGQPRTTKKVPVPVDPRTGKFLGNLNSNLFDPTTAYNPYGRFRSEYSPESIHNPYRNPTATGQYNPGSARIPYSVNPPRGGSSAFLGRGR
ncbi:hypothetical protein [Candidatus Nitrosacidococcus tergens]|uniref:Uncharacterized protein n=1 Tax=Candidatus Nitrosacidococcus tergens TaxID=553981 RepID=A0A7G1Q8X4_9GAMM|nr:hypothetical protein [Candidatus Nitrosacidococcus tergens]CAB1275002.1 exported protein of unknown function [Candidatus Nitrosacidococcus tergens]